MTSISFGIGTGTYPCSSVESVAKLYFFNRGAEGATLESVAKNCFAEGGTKKPSDAIGGLVNQLLFGLKLWRLGGLS